MDIYTTSFCLPRNLGTLSPAAAAAAGVPSQAERSLSPATSFDRLSYSAQRSSGSSFEETGSSVGSHLRTSTEPSSSTTSLTSLTNSAPGGGAGPPGSSSSSISAAAAARSRIRTDSSSARRQAHAQSAALAARRPGSEDVGPSTGATAAEGRENETVQKLCVETMAQHQCLVSATKVGGTEGTGAENVVYLPRRSGHQGHSTGGIPGIPGIPGGGTGSTAGSIGSLRDFVGSNYDPSRTDSASLSSASLPGGPPGSATSINSASSLSNVPGPPAHHHHPSLQSSTPAAAFDPAAVRGKGWNFCLSGGYQSVMSARGHLLRDASLNASSSTSSNPLLKRRSVVKVPRSEVLNPDPKESVKVEMKRKLDEIASLTRAHLAIVGQQTPTQQGQGAEKVGWGLETERNVEIVITGGYENVEQARVRLLVLLDELSGLHSEVCEIDYKLHNIIAGRKRCVVQTIQEETATNIYFPTPLSGVLGPTIAASPPSTRNGSLGPTQPGGPGKQNLIFITGEFFGVQRARDMLFQVSMHKSKCIISRDTAILPRKLDWMLTDRLDELKSIMNDNGTFINFPVVGSQNSMISVYGDHRVNIERSIRSVMQLACQFYVASFWLLPVSFDVFMPHPSIQPSQVPPVLKHISSTTGCEAVFKSNCFELHGTEGEVRQAVGMVLDLEMVRPFHHEIRFQIELANEHREFISGKKNGKLNKIMKTANVKIKFETFNDYNFLIDIAGNDEGALAGLSLLQEELPAEISFHIPEGYHKRIIGVGGKNIQRIMKKYGVYVKFSNAEDHAQLGGYVDNEDNVVARTPAKNAMNLDNLKQSVMEMVHPKDKDFVVETVSIPRRYHRTLLGEKSIFIHDIEAKTNSTIRFPNKETASDIVVIFGPESQVHIAAQMLLVHIAFEAEYRLPHSSEMAQLVLSPDWVAVTERIKRDFNVTVLPFVDRSGTAEETIIKFCLNRSNVDYLGPARDIIEDFLVGRKINLYPGSLRPRADSFADAFPYFNSKLLSTGGTDGEHHHHRTESKSKDLRAINSTPDIKALFDAPGSSYTHRGQETDTAGAFPPIVGSVSMSSGDYSQWSAPRQMAPSYSPQAAFAPAPSYSPVHSHGAHRLAAEETGVNKRASDHQLEEKMRRSTPRSFVPRAQSLDMGRFEGSIPAAPSSATLPRSTFNDRTNTDLSGVFSNLGLNP